MEKNDLFKILSQENIELGRLIKDLREKGEILQKDLYGGLCSKEVYTRVERGNGITNELLAERILSRLHLQYRLLDMMINEEDFWLKECRYQIDRSVDNGNLEEAQRLLLEYANRAEAEQPLHKQYMLWKRAQIEQKVSRKRAGELYKEALDITMPSERFEKHMEKTSAISEEELQMYFGYRNCARPFSTEEYEYVLGWIEENMIQSQVYPSCYFETGLLYAEELYCAEAYKECLALCDTMLHWQVKGGKHYYLVEFHFLRAKVRMSMEPSEKERKDIRQECRMAYYTALTFGKGNMAEEIENYCMEEYGWHIISSAK